MALKTKKSAAKTNFNPMFKDWKEADFANWFNARYDGDAKAIHAAIKAGKHNYADRKAK